MVFVEWTVYFEIMVSVTDAATDSVGAYEILSSSSISWFKAGVDLSEFLEEIDNWSSESKLFSFISKSFSFVLLSILSIFKTKSCFGEGDFINEIVSYFFD